MKPATFAFLVLALLAGCTPGADLPLLPEATPGAYRLGTGDQVRIIVLGADQLSAEYRVGDDGRIAVPLVGGVQAANLTSAELAQNLAATLKSTKVLTNPSVSVEIESYRPIFVLGEVAKPGEYAYRPGMTMLTAVAVAGGFTYRGVQDYAGAVRVSKGVATQGRIVPDSFILPGDVVRVFERRF